jgi:hypothetical protein
MSDAHDLKKMAAQAVDLHDVPCSGCRHDKGGVCRRFPPVWTTPAPIPDKSGQVVGMSPGGWSFPPAARRCGEHANTL